GEGRPEDGAILPDAFAPALTTAAPLTFAAPPAEGAPAAALLRQDPRASLPALRVWSVPPNAHGTGPLFQPAAYMFTWDDGAAAVEPGAWVRQSVARALSDINAGVARPASWDVLGEALRRWHVRPDL